MAPRKAGPMATLLMSLILLLGSQQVLAGTGFAIFVKRAAGGPAGNRKLHQATATKKEYVRVRWGAAVLSKVSNCPGIKPSDVVKLVAKTKVKARIGAIPKAPTPEAARFAGQTITMYIAPKALTAKQAQDVMGSIAGSLSRLPYCPFEGDNVLSLEVTLISIQPVAKRQLTATDKKILKCLPKIKVTMKASHVQKINTAAAAKAGTLVVTYLLSS